MATDDEGAKRQASAARCRWRGVSFEAIHRWFKYDSAKQAEEDYDAFMAQWKTRIPPPPP